MTLPPPVLTCGELAGACSLSWLLDELLLLEPVESPASLDELDPDDELPLLEPLVVAAWLAPGRMATTTPAAATLATVTVTVAAFSLRRPCSRSATARATWRCPAGAACSCRLFMSYRVTCPGSEYRWRMVKKCSACAGAPPGRQGVAAGACGRLCGRGLRHGPELPLFSNAQ